MAADFIDYGALPVEEAVRAARTSSRRRQVLDAAVKVMGSPRYVLSSLISRDRRGRYAHLLE